jgi:hypothetical protein
MDRPAEVFARERLLGEEFEDEMLVDAEAGVGRDGDPEESGLLAHVDSMTT